MARHLLGMLMALTLSACAMIPSNVSPDRPVIETTDYYMDYVCEVMVVECDAIEVPTVVYTALLQMVASNYGPGVTLLGMTIQDEPYLYVNPERSPKEMVSTIVHEMVHYVLFHVYPNLGTCEHEMMARLVQAAWDGKPYSEEWRERYDCVGEEVTEDDAVDDSW